MEIKVGDVVNLQYCTLFVSSYPSLATKFSGSTNPKDLKQALLRAVWVLKVMGMGQYEVRADP